MVPITVAVLVLFFASQRAGTHRIGAVFGWIMLLWFLSIGIAGFFIYWMRTATRSLTGWALGLVVGGALGNVVDRIRFGAVADFLDFSGLYFPWVFNVADAAITVGAVLLALDFIVQGRAERKAAAQAGNAQPPAQQ